MGILLGFSGVQLPCKVNPRNRLQLLSVEKLYANTNRLHICTFDFYEREVNVYHSANNDDKYDQLVNSVTNEWKRFLTRVIGPMDFEKWPVKFIKTCAKTANRSDSSMYVAKCVDCIVARRSVQFLHDEVKADISIFFNLIGASYYKESFEKCGS